MENSLRKPVKHSMLRRCKNWDYCQECIYMITLTLADRSQPLLGTVVPVLPPGKAPAEVSPQEMQAEFQPSPLGNDILEHWKKITEYTPEITPLYMQLMEEHLHAILRVTSRLKKPLGNAIGGFKTWCNKHYKEMAKTEAKLFSDGFQDTILFHAGQLTRMFNYLRDNPRRWAVRKLFPEMFTILRTLHHVDGDFTAFGNSFLLQKSNYYLLQTSRSISAKELAEKRQDMWQAVHNDDAVIVSACISAGEKQLMREALDGEASLIALKNNGFGSVYKPPGKFFDACAAGRLLMLAPKAWGYSPVPQKLSREQCQVLNSLAAEIAGGLPQDIHYNGSQPNQLEELLQKAGFKLTCLVPEAPASGSWGEGSLGK